MKIINATAEGRILRLVLSNGTAREITIPDAYAGRGAWLRFNAFVYGLETSNPGFHWRWDETELRGLTIK